MIRIFAAALVLTGCLVDPPVCYEEGCVASHERIERQDEAEAIVWRGVYERVDEPPRVVWVARGDCPDGVAFTSPDGCLLGAYREGVRHVWIALGRDAWGSYAHETLHAVLHRRDGDLDPHHKQPEWTSSYLTAKLALINRGFQVEINPW